jgi:hypothetical protein
VSFQRCQSHDISCSNYVPVLHTGLHDASRAPPGSPMESDGGEDSWGHGSVESAEEDSNTIVHGTLAPGADAGASAPSAGTVNIALAASLADGDETTPAPPSVDDDDECLV